MSYYLYIISIYYTIYYIILNYLYILIYQVFINAFCRSLHILELILFRTQKNLVLFKLLTLTLTLLTLGISLGRCNFLVETLFSHHFVCKITENLRQLFFLSFPLKVLNLLQRLHKLILSVILRIYSFSVQLALFLVCQQLIYYLFVSRLNLL